MITRKDYMSGSLTYETHSVYYSQFVTKSVLNLVREFLKGKTVNIKDDPHLNSIYLHLWDSLSVFLPDSSLRLLKEANEKGGVSLSDRICVLKEAARMILTEERKV